MRSVQSPAILDRIQRSDPEFRKTRTLARWSFVFGIFSLFASAAQLAISYFHASDFAKQTMMAHQLSFCERLSSKLVTANLAAVDFHNKIIQKKSDASIDLRSTPESKSYDKAFMELAETQSEGSSILGSGELVDAAVFAVHNITMGDDYLYPDGRSKFTESMLKEETAVGDCYKQVRNRFGS